MFIQSPPFLFSLNSQIGHKILCLSACLQGFTTQKFTSTLFAQVNSTRELVRVYLKLKLNQIYYLYDMCKLI